jgi:hypothetical protein
VAANVSNAAKEALMKTMAAVVLAIFAVVVFAAGAAAQEPLEYKVTVKAETVKGSPTDHFLTFDKPVHIPDVTLPAGTYIFSVLGSSVVQVSNVDRTELYALFFTAPATRAVLDEHVSMAFARTSDSAPLRIEKWFPPNRAIGFEFLYPSTELRGER